MEDLMQLAANIPTWIWIVVGVFLYVVIFGDKKLWELEVKFPQQPGVGRGEIEFECFKKRGSQIEVELHLEEMYQNKNIEIFLNNSKVFAISAEDNKGSRLSVNKPITLSQPNENDKVEVHIDGQKQFEGHLYRD